MSEKRVRVDRKELERVLELMDRFECADVELVQRNGGGIGYILNAHFETSIADTPGVYIVEITGVDEW